MGNKLSLDEQFLLDHLDPKSGRFDVYKIMSDALLAELAEEDEEQLPDDLLHVKERRKRKRYPKRDPKTTFWFIEYVLNPKGSYNDQMHRDYKLFKKRFVIDHPSVAEIVDTIRTLPEDKKIWSDKHGIYFLLIKKSYLLIILCIISL